METLSRRIAFAASLVTAVAMFFLFASIAVVALDPSRFTSATLIRIAVAWVPALFYLRAVLAIRRLALLATTPTVALELLPVGLRQVGAGLAVGGVLSVGSGVVLMALFSGAAGGFPVLQMPGLVVATLGVLLVGISRLLTRAAELEAQNRKLESELREFV
jgi:hypothetical protein